MQFWWITRKSEDGTTFAYFCNADGRETAKQMASKFLLGDPDLYEVNPLTNPGDIVKARINISTGVPSEVHT